jgi:hypothetical protein
MFDPSRPDAILGWQDKDLPLLPPAEDDRHEYKSSATKDPDLGDKIARAASAFWNSGGGLFVAGVNGQGQADGGIPLTVGRQSRRDWIDQAIAKVTPRAQYVVHFIEDRGAGARIDKGSAVYLIGFGESAVAPHMAPDNRYYIRAGAHTAPASHFFVEALYARRGLRTPVLRHVVRRKPGGILQVGVLALNPVPAVDVEISFDPVPRFLETWAAQGKPLQIPVISDQFPFFVDVSFMTRGEQVCSSFNMKLSYRDLTYRPHQLTFLVNLETQLGPSFGGGSETSGLERELQEVKQALGQIAEAVRITR